MLAIACNFMVYICTLESKYSELRQPIRDQGKIVDITRKENRIQYNKVKNRNKIRGFNVEGDQRQGQ